MYITIVCNSTSIYSIGLLLCTFLFSIIFEIKLNFRKCTLISNISNGLFVFLLEGICPWRVFFHNDAWPLPICDNTLHTMCDHVQNTFHTTVIGWITSRVPLYDLSALIPITKSNRPPSRMWYKMAPNIFQVHLPQPQESLFNGTYFITKFLYKYFPTNEYSVFYGTK